MLYRLLGQTDTRRTRSLNSIQGLSRGCQGLNYLGHLLLPGRGISRELEQKQSGRTRTTALPTLLCPPSSLAMPGFPSAISSLWSVLPLGICKAKAIMAFHFCSRIIFSGSSFWSSCLKLTTAPSARVLLLDLLFPAQVLYIYTT